jgi:hypothetical protein
VEVDGSDVATASFIRVLHLGVYIHPASAEVMVARGWAILVSFIVTVFTGLFYFSNLVVKI